MRSVWLAVCVIWLGAACAFAQDVRQARSPILTLDSERVFDATPLGKSVSSELERLFRELETENRRIEAELTAEEQALTEQRPTLEPDAFRELADAFDAKVQQIRSEQLEKERTLLARQETDQQKFLEQITPILAEIGNRYGAVVIVERRNVLLAADGIDITNEAIARIEQAFGDNSPDAPSEPAPETDP